MDSDDMGAGFCMGLGVAMFIMAIHWVTGALIESGIRTDCDKIGKFRIGSHVYVCHKEKE